MIACSKSEDQTHAALLDEIERQVQLPKGANSLGEYARYYAYDAQRKIVGVYLEPSESDAREAGEQCEELEVSLKGDLASHVVPCPPTTIGLHNLKAGERRWDYDYRQLPSVADGGCGIVHVLFNPGTEKVEHVLCNGQV